MGTIFQRTNTPHSTRSIGLLFMVALWSCASVPTTPLLKLSSNLASEDRNTLKQTLHALRCPDEAKSSLLQCLQNSPSAPAVHLAAYATEQIKQGFGVERTLKKTMEYSIRQSLSVDVVIRNQPHIGAQDPRVVLIEFGDFNCEKCAAFDTVAKKLLQSFRKDLTLVFVSSPNEIDPDSMGAARFALAAHHHDLNSSSSPNNDPSQSKFWTLHDKLFAEKRLDGSLHPDNVNRWAQTNGIKIALYKEQSAVPLVHETIDAMYRMNLELRNRVKNESGLSKVRSPLLLLGNQKRRSPLPAILSTKIYLGEKNFEALKQEIENLLAPSAH